MNAEFEQRLNSLQDSDFIKSGRFRAGVKWRNSQDGVILHETYQFDNLEELKRFCAYAEKSDITFVKIVSFRQAFGYNSEFTLFEYGTN